jgi:hypothetical protein
VTPAGLLLYAVSGILLGIVIRNILGSPWRPGIVLSRIAMVGFSGVAAFFFWKARELRESQAPSEVVFAAQRVMLGALGALVMAAASVGVQRRRMRLQKPTAPAPSTSGPPEP